MHRCDSGLDFLLADVPARYRGARVGLIANPASVDAQLHHAADRFAACREIRLSALFGPQHGARAAEQDNMIESAHFVDSRLGVPVYSLYSEHRKPTSAMLADIDILFCDLVDVGCRAYTFMWTMLLAMEACAEAGRKFVVLDRPNPIGGVTLEGPTLESRFTSFIGLHPLPMRHGMTIGELALLFNAERRLGADLDVIPCRGWQRPQWAADTGLPWVMPSPNMPTPDTAAVYPGTVLIEGTNLSEGRGTTRPFEIVGAPYLDAHLFAGALNARSLPGVRFRPVWFTPVFEKWKDQLCGGAQVHVTNRVQFRPYLTGLAILATAVHQGGEQFAWRQPPFEYEHSKMPIDILAGTARVREQLEVSEDSTAAFDERRKPFLLY